MQERFFEMEKRISVTHSTPQDAPYHISCPVIRWQLSVGYRKTNGADMVCQHPHGNIRLFIAPIRYVRFSGNVIDNRLEYVSIVIGGFLLDYAHQSFEPHSCIYMFRRQWVE